MTNTPSPEELSQLPSYDIEGPPWLLSTTSDGDIATINRLYSPLPEAGPHPFVEFLIDRNLETDLVLMQAPDIHLLGRGNELLLSVVDFVEQAQMLARELGAEYVFSEPMIYRAFPAGRRPKQEPVPEVQEQDPPQLRKRWEDLRKQADSLLEAFDPSRLDRNKLYFTVSDEPVRFYTKQL